MGNSGVKEAIEDRESSRSLDLSCRLTPAQYIKHTSGEFIEGCLLAIPWEIYYNTLSMYESINASFNFINEIPEEISLRIPHLRHLNLSHNQIPNVPQSFHLLLHLRSLDLSHNRLQEFPAPVSFLPQLHTLNLANNRLAELPATISRLHTLRKLNVSNNRLRALPGSLVECPELSVIVTRGNELIHPPQAICDSGSQATLKFLRDRHTPAIPASCGVKENIFMRVRGQQVMASVSNPESASVEYRQAQGTSRNNKRKCPLMPPATATSLSPDQLTDVLLGLVYGLAVGDALALGTEGLTEDECSFFYDPDNVAVDDRIQDLVRAYYPPGDWSSNTDFVLLTLESLMRWGGVVDELEVASQLDQWRVHGFPELDPLPGHPLSPFMKKVISSKGYSGNPHTVAEANYRVVRDDLCRGIHTLNPSDNSCLPPALVLGIPCFHVEGEVEMNAERICRATHAAPLPRAACVFLALLLAAILQGVVVAGKGAGEAVAKLQRRATALLPDSHDQDKFAAAFTSAVHHPAAPRGSSVLTSITLLIRALSKDKLDFKREVMGVVMGGGEGVCVHAGVVGGVLGAVLGYSQLPHDWLKQLPPTNIRVLNSKLNLLLDLFGLP